MNKKDFESILLSNKKIIDEGFNDFFDLSYNLYEPLTYAVRSGKRIRPNLFFETLKMLGKDIKDNDIKFALCLEMIHAYSLVHDDLPAMDNDDYRRGEYSCHKKFGEDIAILTGDALITEASHTLFEICKDDSTYIYPASLLMQMAGYKDMIYGQVLDIRSHENIDLDYLLLVYEKKTADLFRAAIVGAALASDNHFNENRAKDFKNLDQYASNLGLAFQIQDDLLEENYQDELNILNLISRNEAFNLLYDINKKAKENISHFNDNEFLLYLVDYLTNRNN